MDDLIEIKHILTVFLNEVRRRHLKIEHGIIGKIADEVDFEFFHSKPDCHGDISPASQMSMDDTTLTHSVCKGASQNFSDTGTFVRGCVRIAPQCSV